MNAETYNKTIKDARNYMTKRFGNVQVGSDKLLNAILGDAFHMQPRSWGNHKRSIALLAEKFKHHDLAHKIKQLNNPAVENKEYPTQPKKIKKVNHKDFQKILTAAKTDDELHIASAIYLAYRLGLRPSEMQNIEILANGGYKITTSKKNDSGERGIDRIIKANDDETAKAINKAITNLEHVKIKNIQDNMATLMRRIFPRRKRRPTLYTFRHQYASNLKAEGYSKKVIAYLLGHQSTRTQENYGHIQSGRRGETIISPGISSDEIKDLIRDKHTAREQRMKERLLNQNQLTH